MIQQKIFQSIELSFLPVGHTHEDIDQMFSRFSIYFKSHDAITIEMFGEGCSEEFTPSPKIERIFEIANFKSIILKSNVLNEIECFNNNH